MTENGRGAYADYRRGKYVLPARSKTRQCSSILRKAIANVAIRIRRDICPHIFSEDFPRTEPFHPAAIETIPDVAGRTGDPASIDRRDPTQHRSPCFSQPLQSAENRREFQEIGRAHV